MPRERSYESERRHRTKRVNRALDELRRLAVIENEQHAELDDFGEAPTGSNWAERRRMQKQQTADALSNLFDALVQLNYLEWEVRGAGD